MIRRCGLAVLLVWLLTGTTPALAAPGDLPRPESPNMPRSPAVTLEVRGATGEWAPLGAGGSAPAGAFVLARIEAAEDLHLTVTACNRYPDPARASRQVVKLERLSLDGNHRKSKQLSQLSDVPAEVAAPTPGSAESVSHHAVVLEMMQVAAPLGDETACIVLAPRALPADLCLPGMNCTEDPELNLRELIRWKRGGKDPCVPGIARPRSVPSRPDPSKPSTKPPTPKVPESTACRSTIPEPVVDYRAKDLHSAADDLLLGYLGAEMCPRNLRSIHDAGDPGLRPDEIFVQCFYFKSRKAAPVGQSAGAR